MEVFWNEHATQRFLERVIVHNIVEKEVENAVRHQRVKTKKGFDKKYNNQKFECVEKINDVFITIQKAESKSMIYIITLWESKKMEELLWRKSIKKK